MSYRKNSRAKLARFMLALSIMGGVGHKMADRSSYALNYATNDGKMEGILLDSAFDKQAGPVYQRFDFDANEIGKKGTADTLTLVDMILSSAGKVDLNTYKHDGKGVLTRQKDYPLGQVKTLISRALGYALTADTCGYNGGNPSICDLFYPVVCPLSNPQFAIDLLTGKGSLDEKKYTGFVSSGSYNSVIQKNQEKLKEFSERTGNKVGLISNFLKGLMPRKAVDNNDNNNVVILDNDAKNNVDEIKSYLVVGPKKDEDGNIIKGVLEFAFEALDDLEDCDELKLSDDELLSKSLVVLASNYELKKSFSIEFNTASVNNNQFLGTFNNSIDELTKCLSSEQIKANVFTFDNGKTLYKASKNPRKFALVPMLFAIEKFKSCLPDGNVDALKEANEVYGGFLESPLADDKKIVGHYTTLCGMNGSALNSLSEENQKTVLDTVESISELIFSADMSSIDLSLLNGAAGLSSTNDVNNLLIGIASSDVDEKIKQTAKQTASSVMDKDLNTAIMELLQSTFSGETVISEGNKKKAEEVESLKDEVNRLLKEKQELEDKLKASQGNVDSLNDKLKAVNAELAKAERSMFGSKSIIGILLGLGMVGGIYAGHKTGTWKKLYKNLKDRIDAASNRNKKASGPNISHSN